MLLLHDRATMLRALTLDLDPRLLELLSMSIATRSAQLGDDLFAHDLLGDLPCRDAEVIDELGHGLVDHGDLRAVRTEPVIGERVTEHTRRSASRRPRGACRPRYLERTRIAAAGRNNLRQGRHRHRLHLRPKATQQGRAHEAYHLHPEGGPSPARAELWEQGTPSVRRIISATPTHWSRRLSLNETGPPADRAQKAKDDYERAFLPSVPVLHMVHGFNECAQEIGPSINRWEERDPITAMLLNADLWIWEALAHAERWRQLSRHFPGMISPAPSDMIRLIAPADVPMDDLTPLAEALRV